MKGTDRAHYCRSRAGAAHGVGNGTRRGAAPAPLALTESGARRVDRRGVAHTPGEGLRVGNIPPRPGAFRDGLPVRAVAVRLCGVAAILVHWPSVFLEPRPAAQPRQRRGNVSTVSTQAADADEQTVACTSPSCRRAPGAGGAGRCGRADRAHVPDHAHSVATRLPRPVAGRDRRRGAGRPVESRVSRRQCGAVRPCMSSVSGNSVAPTAPHFQSRTTAVILLFTSGGVSPGRRPRPETDRDVKSRVGLWARTALPASSRRHAGCCHGGGRGARPQFGQSVPVAVGSPCRASRPSAGRPSRPVAMDGDAGTLPNVIFAKSSPSGSANPPAR